MGRVTVSLPRLLEPAIGKVRKTEVEGSSVAEAINSLLIQHPTLGVHLFDEHGDLRPHVLCFVNGSQTRLEDRTGDLADGSEIAFLQAVSGGIASPEELQAAIGGSTHVTDSVIEPLSTSCWLAAPGSPVFWVVGQIQIDE